MNVQVENSMSPMLRHTGAYLVLSTLKRFLFCTQGSLSLSVIDLHDAASGSDRSVGSSNTLPTHTATE